MADGPVVEKKAAEAVVPKATAARGKVSAEVAAMPSAMAMPKPAAVAAAAAAFCASLPCMDSCWPGFLPPLTCSGYA